MDIIQRTTWGAKHEDGSGARALPAAEAWLHHSVTIAPDLVPPFDDEYRAMRTLESIGEQRFGRGISYTFCVMPNGRVYEGHSVGRIGAHTGGRNTKSMGICLVGNYQTSPFGDHLVRTVAELLQHCAVNGWLQRPALNGGHRNVSSTGCPGDNAYRRIPEINKLALGPKIIITPPTEDDMTPEERKLLITPAERALLAQIASERNPEPGMVGAVVGMAACATGGYWQVMIDGGVANFGGAPMLGSASGQVTSPALGIVGTPTGKGYWIFTDNGLFCFGDAKYHGRVGDLRI